MGAFSQTVNHWLTYFLHLSTDIVLYGKIYSIHRQKDAFGKKGATSINYTLIFGTCVLYNVIVHL